MYLEKVYKKGFEWNQKIPELKENLA